MVRSPSNPTHWWGNLLLFDAPPLAAADPDYHALGLYESLGFERCQRTAGVCRQPAPPAAG